MAKAKGRLFLLQLETGTPGTYATVGGFKSNTFSINGEEVDVTTKGDAPWKTLMEDAGIRSLSTSGDGVMEDSDELIELMEEGALGQLHKNFKILSALGDFFEGTFQIVSFERKGEYNGAETFSVSLSSSGEVEYTAPA